MCIGECSKDWPVEHKPVPRWICIIGILYAVTSNIMLEFRLLLKLAFLEKIDLDIKL